MRAEFLGVPIDLLTHDQTVGRAIDAMLKRKTTHHVAMNVAKLVKSRRDPELRRDVAESHIVGIDGMGIVWGARALGIKVPERVAGVDLMESLLGICAAHDFRPYFLGARHHVLQKALINALHRWPGLRFAGYHDGYFNREDEPQIVERNPGKPRRLPVHRDADAAQGAVPASASRRARRALHHGRGRRARCSCRLRQARAARRSEAAGSSGFIAPASSRGACGGATSPPTRCSRRCSERNWSPARFAASACRNTSNPRGAAGNTASACQYALWDQGYRAGRNHAARRDLNRDKASIIGAIHAGPVRSSRPIALYAGVFAA